MRQQQHFPVFLLLKAQENQERGRIFKGEVAVSDALLLLRKNMGPKPKPWGSPLEGTGFIIIFC